MHLIISKDREEIQRALHALLREKNEPLTSFFPENFTIDAFAQEVETYPFLVKHKHLIVHEIDKLSKENLLSIHSFVSNPTPWISLYLTATHLHPQDNLIKLVKKQGKVMRFKEEKPWEKEKKLANWLIQEALAQGVEITLPVAQALVKAVDDQMLTNELEKLICFVAHKKEIALEDISLISTPVHHETLWQLGDALFARKSSQALQIGAILIEAGLSIFPLLANLRSQFATGLEILHAADKGEVQQKFPYLKGALLDKKLKLLKQYGKQSLERGTLLIFDAEIQAKNNAEPYLLLELLIVKLTHDLIPSTQCIGAC